MPCIKDKSTVEAIARGFISNKRNKYKGLKAAGYAHRYALTCGQKLYEDIRVKEAIARIDAVSVKKSKRTVQTIDDMQQAAYDLAMRLKQPSAAVSAGTAIARLYGMDKDAGAGLAPPVEPLSDVERAELSVIAQGFMRGPKLAKEG